MKQLLFLISVILIANCYLQAQLPEDALRLSWSAPSGTARQQAIGGAMGSLGGEITTSYVNPAGLAFYKISEFVVSPGYSFQKDKSNYRGTSSSANSSNNFNLGASGFVFARPGNNGSGSALSISVNRTANFNSNTYYQGQNDYSSFSEQYVEEFVQSGLSIDNALYSPQLSYGTRMALYTYLIDTATINGVTKVIGQPQKSSLLFQQNAINTTGGVTEIAIAFAGTNLNKWYFGGTLGIPILSYTRNSSFTETDASQNPNNDFAFSTYNEKYTTHGAGINLKLGMIFRPVGSLRLGLAVHTPTIYALTDNLSASMVTNTENYTAFKQISITSDSLDAATGTYPGQVKYDATSPWKFIVSGAYVFGETPDVKEQKGFVTADLEYVTNRSVKYSAAEMNGTTMNGYYDAVNGAIKGYYKNTFDLRIGGELKFNTLAVRGGFAYYTSPYQQSELKANRMYISGGAGYRNKGIFVDLTYVQGFTNDVNFPYRLADKENTYASIKQSSGTVLLTIGCKFK